MFAVVVVGVIAVCKCHFPSSHGKVSNEVEVETSGFLEAP